MEFWWKVILKNKNDFYLADHIVEKVNKFREFLMQNFIYQWKTSSRRSLTNPTLQMKMPQNLIIYILMWCFPVDLAHPFCISFLGFSCVCAWDIVVKYMLLCPIISTLQKKHPTNTRPAVFWGIQILAVFFWVFLRDFLRLVCVCLFLGRTPEKIKVKCCVRVCVRCARGKSFCIQKSWRSLSCFYMGSIGIWCFYQWNRWSVFFGP